MTYAVWTPAAPTQDLQGFSDADRRILYEDKYSRAIWQLDAMQQSLAANPPLKVLSTPKAQWEMKEQLAWSHAELLLFLKALTRGRYIGSQWCYAPKGNTPHACDVYVMGFNRHTGEENPQFQPWAYIKFGFIGPAFTKLAIFSAHPEGQYQGEVT